jgi:hypothetical protein
MNPGGQRQDGLRPENPTLEKAWRRTLGVKWRGMIYDHRGVASLLANEKITVGNST